jgi:hypothetical protein
VNKKRGRDGKKVVIKKVAQIPGDGNCGPVSLQKAVSDWLGEGKRGLNFLNQADVREKVAAHAKILTPALREQFFEGNYAEEATVLVKEAFVMQWAREAREDRRHVDLLFCRLFADMVKANLSINEVREGNLMTRECYKLLDEDSELPREAKEGREIELFYSSFLHEDGKRTGHFDLVKTTWT